MSDHLAPQPQQYVRIPPSAGPMLVVTVDTEEDFDWSAPFSSTNVRVDSARQLPVAQALFAEHGIAATYVVDYPIASQPEGYGFLREVAQDGACVIGAQLHPWVNPPLEETVSSANSYPGNLPPELERRKIETLTQTIERNFGRRPTVYKAGRYGVGPNTGAILAACGYEIDLSVYAHRSFRAGSGPDFTDIRPQPFRFGPQRRLLAIPFTCGFTGLFARAGAALYPHLTQRPLSTARLPGAFARLGLLNRVTLTPEGVTLGEAKTLTRRLLADGTRVFTLAFHSPSLQPGNTPYVRSQADLDALLGWLKGYFEFFLGEVGGRPVTPMDLRALCDTLEPEARRTEAPPEGSLLPSPGLPKSPYLHRQGASQP